MRNDYGESEEKRRAIERNGRREKGVDERIIKDRRGITEEEEREKRISE